ncbi:cob(I)yrinic acid a,c-diamide adenosyltransferase [candidate division KSB1 bacterium]|nr:cob(I)yrinic acid a,c-diamide adenosyltransferase [candidate division KSB1 bacterium]
MPKKADVYTRTGDVGTTGLFGGSRIEKDSLRVEAYGTIDELCAMISVIKALDVDSQIKQVLTQLQVDCHDINAEIASDSEGQAILERTIGDHDVANLERLIDTFDEQLPKLMHFISPVETQSAAFLNLARTICRRAERRLWALSRQDDVNLFIIRFFNRLADLLFTMMRVEGQRVKPGPEPKIGE